MKVSIAPFLCALFALTGGVTRSQPGVLDGLRTPARETGPAVSARPNLTDEQRGDIYMARKMYREAVESYSKGPENSAVLANKIGIAYHQLTFLPQARKQYERAQKLDSKYAEAVNNLGTIYYAQKNYKKAITQYRRALKLSPGSASIYSNLGTAFFARRKYKDASAAYQKALELDPDVFEHRNANGVLLQDRSVEERGKLYFYLAKTYASSGANERALIYVRKAIEYGFKERKKFVEDSDFKNLQELAEFQEILKLEVRAL